MIFAQLAVGDIHLLSRVIRGLVYFVHEPLVAGSGGEHAAHEMIAAVGMGEGMDGVVVRVAEGL